ncbi:MAG: PspC domain-containing protein [Oscillochloris sp.]|nr:PspC domain-containing protein [Oscillochloris sp.]
MTMTTKLQRSRNDKMIAGVCAGLAQYFGVDVAMVRLVAAFLLLFTHVAIVPIYIILWVVIPEELAAEAPRYDAYTGQPLS